MGKSNELVIVNSILTKTSYRYSHSILIVYIHLYLRTVILLKILDELLRSAWKLKLLRKSLKLNQLLDQLLFGRFLAEFNEYSCCMSVENRNTYTLACDDRCGSRNDHTVLDLAPES